MEQTPWSCKEGSWSSPDQGADAVVGEKLGDDAVKRATVDDMGPVLLSRMLELNEVQEGVLNVAFRVAADEKLPLRNLADLRAIINNVAERAR